MAHGQSDSNQPPRAVARTKIRALPWFRSPTFYTRSTSSFEPVTEWLPVMRMPLEEAASSPVVANLSKPAHLQVQFEIVLTSNDSVGSPEEA